MHDTPRQSGPDFLDSYAEANLNSGLEVNAAEFRARAKDWRRDQQRIEALEVQVAVFERQLRSNTDRDLAIATLKTQLQAANDSLARITG